MHHLVSAANRACSTAVGLTGTTCAYILLSELNFVKQVHGAPMSRIHRDQRLDEDAKAKMEAIKAIPPEERAR